jgi:hypothetical protein
VRLRDYEPGDLGFDITHPLGLVADADADGALVVRAGTSRAVTSLLSNGAQYPNDLLTLDALGFDDPGSLLSMLPDPGAIGSFDFIGFE